jgi:hypothetical protein
MELSQVISVLSLLGGIVAVWVNTQTKLKEVEIKLMSLEKQLENSSLRDGTLEKKLDTIFSKLEKIQIQLQNKQDRP